jgi:hypothetical protein
MIARFMVRALREASRPVTMTLPRFSIVPNAMPSRTATCGVMPTLTMPVTPREPNR